MRPFGGICAGFLGSAALLWAATPGYALDFTPDTTRYLSDPSFLPSHGQWEGATKYDFSHSAGDWIDANGMKELAFRRNSSEVGQLIGFGLTDDLRLSVRSAYAFTSRLKDSYVWGATSTGRSDGFFDPTFAVTYRAIDQGASPVSLDVSVDYMPDMLAAKAPSTLRSGTVASGGSAFGAGAYVNREMKSLTLQGFIRLRHQMPRKIENLSDNSPTSLTPLTDFSFGVNTQTRLNDQFSMDVGASYMVAGTDTVTNALRGTSFKDELGNSISTYLAMNYHIIANKLVARLEYDHAFVNDEIHSAPIPTYSGGKWENQGGNTYTVSLLYAF